jgi:hypothetical protein
MAWFHFGKEEGGKHDLPTHLSPTLEMNQTLRKQQTSEQQATTGYPPRYRIFEETVGFCVEGRDRCPVFVRLSADRTHLLVAGTREAVTIPGGNALQSSLYGYYRLLESIALIAMQDWQRPPNPPSSWSGIQQWAIGRTKRALHFRGVYQQWQRLLFLVPEQQRAVAKAVFAATFDSKLGCEIWSEVYSLPNLVEDMLCYRAAAGAVHYAKSLALRVSSVVEQLREGAPATYRPGPLTERFDAFIQRRASNGLVRFDSFKDWEEIERLQIQIDAQDRQDVLDILAHDWKALYSGSGAAGKSLRRTLMNLPGGISGKLLSELPKLDLFLRRPIVDRVELLTFLLWGRYVASYAQTFITPGHWEGDIYVKAQRKEILTALRLLSAHRRRAMPDEAPLTPYRKGIWHLVGYLDYYCRSCRQDGIPMHQGNIVGLTEKALLWHRDVQERAQQLRQALLDGTAQAALPPIPLPQNAAITFLRTAKDILHESASMHHCIADLAEWAVQGHCYLFHVRYRNTEASVQVSRIGRVVQSQGPFNTTNAASEYGASILSKWGKTFPQDGGQHLISSTPRLVDDALDVFDALPF